ncbi:MAG: hypothetical protein Fur0037_09500 [Planctomycetota bacterium]
MTRGSAENYVDASLILTEVVLAHVSLDDVPVSDVLHVLRFVATEGSAGVPIPIEDRDMLKARSGRTKR